MQRYRQIWLMILLLCISMPLFAQPGSVLINEVMYDDTATTDVEWVELYNPTPFPRTLSNWVLTDGNVWPPPSTEGAIMIPPGTLLPPNGYLVISKQPIAEFSTVVCNEVDPSWTLNNAGDNLALFDGNGPTALLIDGSLATSFPDLAVANAGNSVEKRNQNQPWTNDPLAWKECTQVFSPAGRFRHCTPNQPNSPDLPVQCGVIEVTPESNNTLPDTYVNQTVIGEISIRNTGPNPTCIELTGTYSDIFFVVAPPPSVIQPNDVATIQVGFTPPAAGDFFGIVFIKQSDGSNPLRIELEGHGCQPVTAPPALILSPATASHTLQFNLPWDPLNGADTDYAIEYSSDGFTTTMFVDFPFGSSIYPVFKTAPMWGKSSGHIISGLEPSTAYEARLITRDCMGVMAPGPSVIETTLEMLSLQSMSPIDLTIRPLGNDLIRLQWDPLIIADNGRDLQGAQWVVLYGPTEATIDQILTTTTNGVFDIDISGLPSIGFYAVQAVADNVLNTPQPIIAWPPDGARVAGENMIVLSDFLHSNLWLNYEIWLDMSGDAVLLGTENMNPWNLTGKTAIPVDFSHVTPGPHTLTAHVNFVDGNFADIVHNIEIVPLPSVNFVAGFDAGAGLFTVDTTGVQGLWSPSTDIIWVTSQAGTYAGGQATFPWYPGMDSLIVVNPYPVFIERVITESSTIPEDPLLNGGVTTIALTPGDFDIPWITIRCCCEGMLLRTGGVSHGVYGDEEDIPLGPVLTCKDGNYEVGFSFEMVVFIRFEIADAWEMCYWGQDAKGDRTRETVTCTGGPPPTGFAPLDPPVTRVRHKNYGGTDYPH
ncbi:MAG: lamin tail domain-containing protein, partial [bacterium]|nr:lamin tail domain-containing protein [bacterium]